MSKKTSIIVTSVGGRAVGYQILESLQKFRNKYRLIATDMDPFSPGLYEADKAYLLPPSDDSTYIPELLNLAKKEKAKIILFGHESEVKIVSNHKKSFLNKGIIPVVSDAGVVETMLNKRKLADFLTKNNILTPKTVFLKSANEAKQLKFPIVIKPAKDSSGSRNCFIVKDFNELQELLEDIQKDEKIEMIAQEYVGSEDEEYTVGILTDPDGNIIDSIVMRRRLVGLTKGLERNINGKKYILSTGYSQGFFVNQPDVKEYCEHVATLVGAVGPLNIQCRRGKKGVYIFEVHPRFSGSASQRAEMDFNEPDVIVRSFLFKEKIKKIPHKLGYAVMRKFANTVVSEKEYNKLLKK